MADGRMEMGEVGASLVTSEFKLPPARPPNEFERLFLPCLSKAVAPTSTLSSPWPSVCVCDEGVKMNVVTPYVSCQSVGGVFGAAMAKAVTSRENCAEAHGAALPLLQSDARIGGALFGEVAMTCLVTTVVLLGAVNTKTRTPPVPFMVGCTVIINVLAGCVRDLSEPSQSLWSSHSKQLGYWTYHWVYWEGPITGGLIAAALVP